MFIRRKVLFMIGMMIVGQCQASQGGWGGPVVRDNETQELRRAKQAMEDANRAWNDAKIAESNAYMKMNESKGANTAACDDYAKKKAIAEQKKERYEALKAEYVVAYNDVYDASPIIVPIPLPKPAPILNNAPQPVQQTAPVQNGRSGLDQLIDGVNAAANIVNALNGSQAPQHVVVITVPSPALAQAMLQQRALQQSLNRVAQDIDDAAARRKKMIEEHE